MTKGIKHDKDKLRYDLVPVEVHEGLADVITYGAAKYSADNWKHVKPYRYEAAMMRHFNAFRKGEILDSESGKHHLFHAMACLSFLYEHSKTKTIEPLGCNGKCSCTQTLPGSGLTEDDLDDMAKKASEPVNESISREEKINTFKKLIRGNIKTSVDTKFPMTEKEVDYLNNLKDDGK